MLIAAIHIPTIEPEAIDWAFLIGFLVVALGIGYAVSHPQRAKYKRPRELGGIPGHWIFQFLTR